MLCLAKCLLWLICPWDINISNLPWNLQFFGRWLKTVDLFVRRQPWEYTQFWMDSPEKRVKTKRIDLRRHCDPANVITMVDNEKCLCLWGQSCVTNCFLAHGLENNGLENTFKLLINASVAGNIPGGLLYTYFKHTRHFVKFYILAWQSVHFALTYIAKHYLYGTWQVTEIVFSIETVKWEWPLPCNISHMYSLHIGNNFMTGKKMLISFHFQQAKNPGVWMFIPRYLKS